MAAQFNTEQEHLPQLTDQEIREVFFSFFWCSCDDGGGTYESRFGSPDSDPVVKSAYDLLEAGFVEGYQAFFGASVQPAKECG